MNAKLKTSGREFAVINSDRITASCGLCPNRGLRDDMAAWGNMLVCDRCAAELAGNRFNSGFPLHRHAAEPVRKKRIDWQSWAVGIGASVLTAAWGVLMVRCGIFLWKTISVPSVISVVNK